MAESDRTRAKSPTKGTRRTGDTRHWATRTGISVEEYRSPAFRRLYPFDSRYHAIEGNNYHYLDEGEGEPVVMLHGNPTWSFFYRKLVLDLREDYRCLVPDHMGCGLSDKPANYLYNLERHILNLEDWLTAVLPPKSWNGGQINLVVHDWGGPIGFGYAMRHPGRIKRLIVLNTSVFTSGHMPTRILISRWPVIGDFLIRGLNLFATQAAKTTTVRPLPPDVAKAYVMPYNSWKNRVGVNAFVKDIPLHAGTPTHALFRRIEDAVHDGAFARFPTLIQWGMADWCFTPYFLGLWRDRFPTAQVHQYPTAGHYLLEDAGESIAARIREFLARPLP